MACWLVTLFPETRVGQAWSRTCLFHGGVRGAVIQLESISSLLTTSGMVIISLAHQPALEGSHHSSSGRQVPQEKVAPPQALVVTPPQTHSNQKSFPWKEGIFWAGNT